MKIIGAGLAGLLCGALNPGSTIYERQGSLPNNHGALLRFRSDKISKALGIPFKKVRVTKAIWLDGEEVQPTPRIQNMYSMKVLGKYSARSIANIDPVDRYIAPADFIAQLAKRCKIEYNFSWGKEWHDNEPIISTIPLPVMMELFGITTSTNFEYQSIWTRTMNVPGVDLYQTIYFPTSDPHISIYRASFTGSKLIVECVNNHGVNLDDALHAFGLPFDIGMYTIKVGDQKYGKIIEIDPVMRRGITAVLSNLHNIYSLGRYATWRNILLDDVYEDIFKIRDLMNLDSYEQRLKLSEEN